MLFTVSASVGVSHVAAQVASSRIRLEWRQTQGTLLKLLHRRRGGTRTHVLCSVKATILPLIYTPVGMGRLELPINVHPKHAPLPLGDIPVGYFSLSGVSPDLPLSTPMGTRQSKRQYA